MVNRKMKITTTSPFSNGWFVVNDLNDQTDIDFITPDGQVNEDMLFAITGEKLLGKGRKMIFQPDYYGYSHDKILPDGTVERLFSQAVFHVMSDQDLRTYNAASFELYKAWEDEFFSTPEVRKPQDIFVDVGGTISLINDGRMHQVFGFGGPGKFVHYILGADDLYPCVLSSTFNPTINVFDRAAGSFLTPGTTNFFPVILMPGEAVYMEYDMLWMELRPDLFSVRGWAIMRSKTISTEYRLADLDVNGFVSPIVDFLLLDPGLRVLSADVYGVHPTHPAAFYFAKGNQLSYFQKGGPLGGEEVDMFTFPAGETVSYIGKNPSTPNLEVLTNSGNTWKLYIFELGGGGSYPYLAGTTPLAVYTGEGNARYVLYR
jgi:hypothetical protein